MSCGSPAFGERNLDHVEVAGDDGVPRTRSLRLREQLAAEVPRRDVRQREQPHSGVACELGGLARGRVQRVGSAIPLVLA